MKRFLELKRLNKKGKSSGGKVHCFLKGENVPFLVFSFMETAKQTNKQTNKQMGFQLTALEVSRSLWFCEALFLVRVG